MIELTPNAALMLYFSLTLLAIIGIWAKSSLKTRNKNIFVSEKALFTCEYCGNAYLEESSKGVTQCSDCKSFNKNNLFKNRK